MRALVCIVAAASMIAANGYFPADRSKPLLVVYSVSDLVQARDNKGVLITLAPEDAKKFAAITRKHNDGLLLLEADGQVLQAMHISAPIADGIIGFKYPQEESVARYIRRRFRIAEFK